MNNNIEAGMILGFDLMDPKDKSVIDEIEAQFSSLPKAYPEHVVKIESDDELGELLASGRLVDEMAVMPPRPTTSIGEFGAADTVPRIKLKITPLKRALSKAKAAPQSIQSPEASGVDLELVWESKPLTRRDLTIPDGKKTNATGSVNLDKGLLPEEVDHRHYFRDEVFPHLKWATRSKTADEAFAKFQLIRKGISCGEFDLAIRHTTSTTSKAYEQRNAMTRLSWGTMRSYIAQPDLIGRTIAIYRDNADATRFVLEID
ncbi:hypothetical protein LJR230_000227 [Trinickia sp. LjRoot230]|uniref:hypothetical protein n=1 Tax=Trinickia sp. LjRoot230 TaxID=3342288 RepID=UPI003ECDB70D